MRQRLNALLRPTAPDSGLVAAAPPAAATAIIRRFWPYARRHKRLLVLGLLPLLAVPLLDAAEIWVFGTIVDEVVVARDLGPLPALAAALIGLAIVSALASFADDYLATWIGERFVLDVREALVGRLHDLSLRQLGTRRPGDVLSRVTGDVQAIERFVLGALQEAVQAVARIVIFAGALLLLSWQLALAAFVIAPVTYLVARWFGRLVRHAAREKRRRSGGLAAVVEEGLALAPVVRTLGLRDRELARMRAENEATMDAELAATRIRGLYGPVSDLLGLVAGLVIIGLGVAVLSSGGLTVGGLLAFLTYLARLASPLRTLGDLSQDLFAAAAGAERVLELLDEEPEVADRPGARALPAPVRGRLELCDVHAGDGVLRGASLVVRPGELVALVGPSGSGKTTLARLVARLDDPAAGAVRVDGHDVRDVTLESLRNAVGLLWQDTLLGARSPRELLLEARPEATEDQLLTAVRDAGVLDAVDARGWDVPLGAGGQGLSGGERRRLAVARALLRDSAVLVLDEPTTGLDAAARDALREPLRRLVAGRSTLLITHDPEVLSWADRVVELRDGALAERAGAVAA